MADLRELLVTFGSVVKPDDTQLDEEIVSKLMDALAEVTMKVNRSMAAGIVKMAIDHVREYSLDSLDAEAVRCVQMFAGSWLRRSRRFLPRRLCSLALQMF